MQEFHITDLAWKHIGELASRNNNLPLRLSIIAGGCNGFSYRYEFSDVREDLDFVLEKQAVKVLVDNSSMELLIGATLDWEDNLMGSQPLMLNPNANSQCGCGTSFSA
jgi:iron-sulfur cluster insertion protein